jgi:thymidylate kinase
MDIDISKWPQLDIQRLRNIAHKVSGKILVQVEGATCSGKSSFVSDISATLKKKGIEAMIIEEAAEKILTENVDLYEQLITNSNTSEQWKKSKIELQQKVLRHQLENLEQFAENDLYSLALMDRGGASTAYHTIPLISGKDKILIERTCREIAKMSNLITFLHPLVFLDKNSVRYQKTLREIRAEYKGIKHYLDRWRLGYLEIASFERKARARIGIKQILALLNDIGR